MHMSWSMYVYKGALGLSGKEKLSPTQMKVWIPVFILYTFAFIQVYLLSGPNDLPAILGCNLLNLLASILLDF